MVNETTRRRRRTEPEDEEIPRRRRRTGQMDVSIENRVGKEVISREDRSEETDSVDVSDHHTEVELGVGLTRNLGDFESLRVYVAIRQPCAPDDMDDTLNDIGVKVSDTLYNEIDAYLDAEDGVDGTQD